MTQPHMNPDKPLTDSSSGISAENVVRNTSSTNSEHVISDNSSTSSANVDGTISSSNSVNQTSIAGGLLAISHHDVASGSSSTNSRCRPTSIPTTRPPLDNTHSLAGGPLVGTRHLRSATELLALTTALTGMTPASDRPPLTEERKQFLEEALSKLSVDLVLEMKKGIAIVKEIHTKPESYVDANLKTYEEALEKLEDYLYEIDLAQSFYQMDGLNIIAPLLRSKHPSFRSAAASIILECCKNNPYCQKLSLSDEVFGALVKLATSDPNKDAMFKALAAVSAIVDSNPAGVCQFIKYDGLKMVDKAINSGNEKLVNKAIFLVMALAATDEKVKHDLTEYGIVLNLITLLRLSDFLVKEYILRALLAVTKDNLEAQEMCRKHDLQTYLKQLCNTKTESEYEDLVECAKDLEKQLLLESEQTANQD